MKKTFLIIVLLSGLFGIPKSFAQGNDPYLGQIIAVGFNFAPHGWLKCEGQILPINQYTALFSLLGTTYGGNGQTTFALPDLRGRVMVGQGEGPGLPQVDLGEQSGSPSTTLTVSNLPAHSHQLSASNNPGTSGDPSGKVYANSSDSDREYASLGTGTMSPTSITGGNQPINNMQPYTGMYYIICLQGVYPPHP